MEQTTTSVDVVIVGAGPAGLATSACLSRLFIPNIILERDDCHASLWKKRSYDRVKLHLAKQFCELPYMPYPSTAPTFVPKSGFIDYLDNYVAHFGIKPLFNRAVESAYYSGGGVGRWRVVVNNTETAEREVYVGRFLVVASGENGEGRIPEVAGLGSFRGEFMHSSGYVNGKRFGGKDVLVVGCGNSGMEIAFDLSNWGARTSIVARGSVHMLTKETVYLAMVLLKFLPRNMVDSITVWLGKLKYGNLSNYGLPRPTMGPFQLKATTGRTPTIDVGAIDRIKSGHIHVLPSITSIQGNEITFANDKTFLFDAIVFATGFKSTVRNWLKDGKDLLNENGMPTKSFPYHWKGDNGLYCAGFSRMGLLGISNDAKNIANDIVTTLRGRKMSGRESLS